MVIERVRRIMLVLAAATFVQVAAADELVQIIEEKLDALGYDTGAVDGEATVKTAVAISQFQAENGMPVTGEPSPQLAGILSAKVSGSNTVAKSQSASPAGVAAGAVDACLDRKREEKEKLKADKEQRFGKNSKIAQNSSLELTDRDIADCNNPTTATTPGAGAAVATPASTDGSSGSVVPVLDRSTLYWKAIRDNSWQSGAVTEAGYTLCVGGRDPQFRANAEMLLAVRFEATPSVIPHYLKGYDEAYEREYERRKTGGCAMGTDIKKSVAQSYTRNLDWIVQQSEKMRETDAYRAAQQQSARPTPDIIIDANGDQLDCSSVVSAGQRLTCQKAGKMYRHTAVSSALTQTAKLEAYGNACNDPSGAAARATFESIVSSFATANRKALIEQYEQYLQSSGTMAQQMLMGGPDACAAYLPQQYKAYADMLAACREC
jgi:peptidoglycan hydrolase-like protein with peptidoglycan-binding domain